MKVSLNLHGSPSNIKTPFELEKLAPAAQNSRLVSAYTSILGIGLGTCVVCCEIPASLDGQHGELSRDAACASGGHSGCPSPQAPLSRTRGTGPWGEGRMGSSSYLTGNEPCSLAKYAGAADRRRLETRRSSSALEHHKPVRERG